MFARAGLILSTAACGAAPAQLRLDGHVDSSASHVICRGGPGQIAAALSRHWADVFDGGDA